MLNRLTHLLGKHRSLGVFFDTNLLLVVAVGRWNRSQISSYKRTRAFNEREYAFLDALFRRVPTRFTSPNILTELDNLSRQLPERSHAEIGMVVHAVAEDMVEVYDPSLPHLGGKDHARVGLTDALLLNAAKRSMVVTDDYRLALLIESRGGDAVNFNHLRPYIP